MASESDSSTTTTRKVAISLVFFFIVVVLFFVWPQSRSQQSAFASSSSPRSSRPSVSHANFFGPDNVVIRYEQGKATRAEVCRAAGLDVPSDDAFRRRRRSGRGMRAIVTGAAGFIGSHVVVELATTLDFELVVAVDDLSGGLVENVPTHLSNVKFFQVDVKDAEAVDALFRRFKFHYVYHLAAYAAEGLSPFIRSFVYRTNLVASMEVLNAALRSAGTVKAFVFASSIAAYGAASPPIREGESPMHPEDPYGISKLATELDLRAAGRLFDLPYIIFRPHNVFGPRQLPTKYRNVVSIFLRQLMNGEPLTIFGDGQQTRSFSFIDDVAPIIAAAPLVPAALNKEFNVGSEQPTTLNRLATLVAEAMTGSSKGPAIRRLPARFEVANAEATHARLKCVFDPGPSVPLATGLRAYARWVRDFVANRSASAFELEQFDAVEVKRKMPPSWARAELQELPRVDYSLGASANKSRMRRAP